MMLLRLKLGGECGGNKGTWHSFSGVVPCLRAEWLLEGVGGFLMGFCLFWLYSWWALASKE